MTVPKWSKGPGAANVLADFLISVEGQEALLADGGSASVVPGVKGAYPYVQPWDAEKYTNDILAGYRTHWASIFR